MTREELQKLWADKKNWTKIGFYKCAQDPRFIVPKRVKWCGWTANVAHSFTWKSFGMTVLILAVLLLPPTLAAFLLPLTMVTVLVAVGISILLVSLLCHYFASQTE